MMDTTHPGHSAPLYSPRQIFWAGFCGGPFALVYLLSRNFDSLGREDEARRYLLVGLAIALVVLVALVLIPARLSTGVFVACAFSGQILARDRHFAGAKVPPEGTLIHSNWRVFFSILGAFAAWALTVVLVILLLGVAGVKLPE